MTRFRFLNAALILALLSLPACDPAESTAEATPSFRDGPPVPSGIVAAKVPDVHWASKLFYGCLPQDEPPASVTLNVTNEVDGDDKQYIIYTVEAGLHEDSVACIYDVLVDWAEQF